MSRFDRILADFAGLLAKAKEVKSEKPNKAITYEKAPETEVSGASILGGLGGTRTPGQLIMSQEDKSHNYANNKQVTSKENQERAPKRANTLKTDTDVEELIAKWDKLPIHIKEAIKALLQTVK